MIDKTSIVEVLKKHPKGLKAKDIAIYIYGADRKAINQILYSNPQLFRCNSEYEWTLTTNSTPKTINLPTSQNTARDNKHTNKEVFYNYKNFYIEIKQGYHLGKDIKLKLYLFGESDYIIQSSSFNIKCPFCNHISPIHSFDCSNCGHTLHEICEKLYSEWNIDGHRFYITWRAIDEYPENERQRKLYEAVRDFISGSIPHSIRHYFKDVLDELHINTLVMIYQKSLGADKVEEELTVEIDKEKKVAFKQAVKNSLNNNVEAIVTIWRYYQKYLEYKSGSIKFKATDFTITVKLSETDVKDVDIKYFDDIYSLIKQKSEYCLNKAYNNDAIVDYKACKHYMVYTALLNKKTGMKYIQDLVSAKIYGELDLSNDTIYQTIQLSSRDTIEGTEYIKTYHKECDHYCEKVYLKIPLLLSNGELIIRTILGTYCDKCKKYFVLDTEFKKILCEGKIQTQISFSESGSHLNGMDLSPESLLRKCGYTVNANSNVTKEQRQKLLKAIIENKLYTPAKIVSHFRFLVSMNSNVTSRDMSTAISKWQDDITFLMEHYS